MGVDTLINKINALATAVATRLKSVVNTTGDQIIDGVKIFSSAPEAPEFTLTGDGAALRYKDDVRNNPVLQCYKGDNSGSGICIGGGGRTILGGGEAAGVLRNSLNTDGTSNDATELLYLASDKDVCIVPACQTIADRREHRFLATGNVLLDDVRYLYSRTNGNFCVRGHNLINTRGTAPLGNSYVGIEYYCGTTDKNPISTVECRYHTSNRADVYFRAYDPGDVDALTKYADLGISYPANGTPYTYTLTPAADDNTTKIATTAWVTTKLASVAKTALPLSGNAITLPEGGTWAWHLDNGTFGVDAGGTQISKVGNASGMAYRIA